MCGGTVRAVDGHAGVHPDPATAVTVGIGPQRDVAVICSQGDVRIDHDAPRRLDQQAGPRGAAAEGGARKQVDVPGIDRDRAVDREAVAQRDVGVVAALT